MSKVKNILFRLTLKGYGIVNFDGVEQKSMFSDTKLYNMKTKYFNVSYGKKKFYEDKDGNLSFKPSISSNCLRHAIFKEDVEFQSPNVINNEHLLYSFIASPASILRGYLFADKNETLKRKGALTITDAEQIFDIEQASNAVSSIENFTKSGFKDKDEDKNKPDNTFFTKETLGNIKYQAIGNIDLMQLSFISCDQIFDRYAFNPDMFNLYKTLLATKLDGFNSELGFYQIKNSIVEIPEHGFKMTDAQVITLVKELFTRVMKLNITRKGAYAERGELEYKLVYDVIEDTFANEEGWNKISNIKDIEAIDFQVEEFYVERDIELALQKRELIKADMKKRVSDEKAKKAEKAAIAAAKKKEVKELKENTNV